MNETEEARQNSSCFKDFEKTGVAVAGLVVSVLAVFIAIIFVAL